MQHIESDLWCTSGQSVTLMSRPLYLNINLCRENDINIPKVDFPKQFSLSANPKHVSNEEQSITRYHHSIYAKGKRTTQSEYFSARSVDMDVFRGQTTTTIRNLLAPNDIFS